MRTFFPPDLPGAVDAQQNIAGVNAPHSRVVKTPNLAVQNSWQRNQLRNDVLHLRSDDLLTSDAAMTAEDGYSGQHPSK